MKKVFLNIIFFFTAFVVLVLTAPVVAGERPMMPAPEDRAAERYDQQKGATITRDKWGVMDPTPSVTALEYLPKDKYGFVDWAQAMREGKIKPKDSIMGQPASAAPAFNDDVLIKSKQKFMAHVIFPHSAHNAWLNCAPCHPKIFEKKAGATKMTMIGIWKGQFCGRCHDKVAFPIRNCFKCHSVKNVDERRQTRTKSMAGYMAGEKKPPAPFTKSTVSDKKKKGLRSLWTR